MKHAFIVRNQAEARNLRERMPCHVYEIWPYGSAICGHLIAGYTLVDPPATQDDIRWINEVLQLRVAPGAVPSDVILPPKVTAALQVQKRTP